MGGGIVHRRPQHRPVAQVDAVKKAQRHRAAWGASMGASVVKMCMRSIPFPLTEQFFDVQHAARHHGQAKEAAGLVIDAVAAVGGRVAAGGAAVEQMPPDAVADGEGRQRREGASTSSTQSSALPSAAACKISGSVWAWAMAKAPARVRRSALKVAGRPSALPMSSARVRM